MKQIILFTGLLFIYSASTNGQLKFANVIGEQKHEYGISGNTVFRLDSAGNSVWVKDFSGYVIPSTYSNQLIGSAFTGNALYVLELQGWTWTSTLPHTYNAAVIKMDTSGNVQYIIASTVFPGNDYQVIDIYPSLTTGVWVLDDYSPGITHIGGAQLIDSSGILNAHVDFWYGESTIMRELLIMPDLNYIVCINNNNDGLPINTFPALTKISRYGIVLWRKNYNTNLTSGIEYLSELATTVDSSNNIYLLCQLYNTGYNGTIVIKVNSSGNVLVAKYWPDLIPGYNASLHYKNSQLVCSLNGSDIYFDTLLNNTCLTSQSISITVSNNFISNSYPQNYTWAAFIPVNDSSFYYQASSNTDYCAILSTNDFIAGKSSFGISPNPANSNTILISDVPDNCSITISDLEGKIFLQKQIKNEAELDIRSYNPGIYLVSLTNESLSITKKLIIEGQ